MSRACLIGYTGFVGGNLARQYAFDDCYNSRNIEQIRGRSYDLVVCCGVSAVKWQAKAIALETDDHEKAGFHARLKLYQDKKPYRETKP